MKREENSVSDTDTAAASDIAYAYGQKEIISSFFTGGSSGLYTQNAYHFFC